MIHSKIKRQEAAQLLRDRVTVLGNAFRIPSPREGGPPKQNAQLLIFDLPVKSPLPSRWKT
jgi:hypothetical protein